MNPLAQLRDIHLPGAPSWWPPAIGWWLLALAVVLLLITAWFGIRRLAAYLRRRRFHRLLLRELARIQEEYEQHGDTRRLLQSLSILLRRSALSLYPRRQAAARTGADWARWLNTCAGRPVFAPPLAELLADGPYRNTGHDDAPRLLEAVRQWLMRAGGRAAPNSGDAS